VARHGRRHLQKQEDGENAFMSPGKNAGREEGGEGREHLRRGAESGVSVFTVSAAGNNRAMWGRVCGACEAAIRKLNLPAEFDCAELGGSKERTRLE